MSLSSDEARARLHEIQRYEELSAGLRNYRALSPHLFLWGGLWFVGFGATAIYPRLGFVWPVLVTLGMFASFAMARYRRRSIDERGHGRAVATTVAVVAFATAVILVMPARSTAQASAFFPLLIALLFALLGIWGLTPRLIVTAALIWGLTLAGFFLAPGYFALWMAVLGSGTLIGSGWWLRRV